MARCNRCNACRSMYDTAPCLFCNYPHADNRTEEQKKKDDADYEEYCDNNYR